MITSPPTRTQPSLRTIAQLSDLSVNTVSNILNRGKERLYKADTVTRVRKIALENGYRPNFAAKILLSNVSRMIGFVTWTVAADGSINNPAVYPFLVGAGERFVRDGYHLVVISLDEMRKQSAENIPPVLGQHFLDALILQQGRWENLPELQHKAHVPIISWDSGYFDSKNCVHRNELEVGKMLTERLISLGHRRISFAFWSHDYQRILEKASADATAQSGSETNLSSDVTHYSTSHRYHGYERAMADHQLEISRILLGGSQTGVRDRLIASLAEQIMRIRPTAIVCLGGADYFTLELACRLVGMRVPQDISIAACDVESRVPYAYGFSIGGILYDRYAAGVASAEMCLEILSGRSTAVPSKEITGEFTLGDTIAHHSGSDK